MNIIIRLLVIRDHEYQKKIFCFYVSFRSNAQPPSRKSWNDGRADGAGNRSWKIFNDRTRVRKELVTRFCEHDFKILQSLNSS